MIMFLIAIAVLAIVALMFKKVPSKIGSAGIGENPPYYRKQSLLNEKEQVLYYRLIDAMPDHHIMAQVRLADIVGLKQCENWQSWFNKVNRKSVDFVLCDKSFAVLACIELDGKTHEHEDRKKADEHKDEALQAAGIPVVRIAAGNFISTAEIKVLLEKVVVA